MFEKLFEPFYIRGLEVPNRLVMPPMVVNYAGPRGEVTEQLLSYHEARARGGVGLIIVEASYIRDDGKISPGEVGIYDDDLVPGLARLADAIKIHGTRAAIQLIHGGIQARVPQPVGPSAIGRKLVPPPKTPRGLETEEVEALVEDFAKAALRAKRAGFDAVEVHGTHGYLVAQFLSPLTNKRTDKYGADRALFAIEAVQRIKSVCGKSYPVIFRLCADEFAEGGITVDYAKEVAKRLVKEADVDALDVTGGNADTSDMISVPCYHYYAKEGFFIDLAKEVKSVVDVPVISGGLISDPRVAEEAVREGMVDAVFIGRQLIADPEWPRKVREGRLDDIKVCLRCNDGCLGRILHGRPVRCVINPLVGSEYRWPSEDYLPRAPQRKKVVVVGGGPAGLEAARALAIRGHEVVLVDEEESLGGTLRVASVPVFKKRLEKLVKWYEAQLRKLGVKLATKVEATPEVLNELKPDAVVIATGSKPLIPRIPGVENAVVADDVLMGRASVGERVVVIGGGLVGIETALHLAINGKKVTVVEALPEIGVDLNPRSKMALIKPGGLLSKHGVRVFTSTPVVRVEKNGVEVVEPPLKRFFIEADAVVLAVGREPNIDPRLVSAAREVAKEVYVIGDARGARKIMDAIHEGFFTALKV